jgi:hypothetical protein
MKRLKLALNYKRMDDSALVVFATLIYNAMMGNANFGTPYPTLAVLLAAIHDLDAAILSPHPSSVVTKTKRITLEKILLALKTYVELESKDVAEVATSSGFSLRAETSKKPKTFTVTQGEMSGSVDIECVYAGRGACYVWEFINDPINTNTWQQFKITNTSGTQKTGLTAGNKYWFRVKAIVNDTEQSYSDPYMIHVI